MPIVERLELEEAREWMQPHFVRVDAEVVREDLEGCPNCNAKLVYEGRKGEGVYLAFAYCSECDYTEEF